MTRALCVSHSLLINRIFGDPNATAESKIEFPCRKAHSFFIAACHCRLKSFCPGTSSASAKVSIQAFLKIFSWIKVTVLLLHKLILTEQINLVGVVLFSNFLRMPRILYDQSKKKTLKNQIVINNWPFLISPTMVKVPKEIFKQLIFKYFM